MRVDRRLLREALDELFPEGLTTPEERRRDAEEGRSLNGHFQRKGRNGIDREALANEAVWLRLEGKSFAQIGRKLGISAQTALVYVTAMEPSLQHVPEIARRGGRKPGTSSKLSDVQLRALHRIYIERGASISQLARESWRRAGFASADSAFQCIRLGWRRLGLGLRTEFMGSRCEALKAGTKRRCRRPALIGGRYCNMHANPQSAAAHADRMRALSPIGNPQASVSTGILRSAQ